MKLWYGHKANRWKWNLIISKKVFEFILAEEKYVILKWMESKYLNSISEFNNSGIGWEKFLFYQISKESNVIGKILPSPFFNLL